ncbi:MAG: ferrochelatase [Gammaproteobacteria bacterium]
MTRPSPAAAHAAPSRTGVLLVNLGTPDAPSAPAIRRYLREFLSDPRVVEVPRAIWWLILHLFILPLRPRKLVPAYRSVWTEQGSPLLAVSQRQLAGLRQRLGDGLVVELAMSYGNPGLQAAFDAFERQNVRRVFVLPLYPQYSATTTAAALDGVYRQLQARRWPPELRTLQQYHDEPGYIAALAASVQAHWQQQGRGEHLLMSFHSIPQKYLLAGDPYFCHCHKTARLLAGALGLGPEQYSVSFQSRLGRQPWLQPYTDQVLPQLARRGLRRVDVLCPGFAADCLETLEEVAIRYREDFEQAGGEALRYIPALNDAPAHLDLLAALIRHHTQGWTPAPASPAELAARQARARAVAGPAQLPTPDA